jgi:hypothetical protein
MADPSPSTRDEDRFDHPVRTDDSTWFLLLPNIM